MNAQRHAGQVLRRLIVVLVIAGVVVAGGYLAHKYRKRAAVEASLAKGLKAYEAKQYSLAAAELGRYAAVHPSDIQVLLKYADAQVQRPKGDARQAVAAWEQILRQKPAQPEAAEQLSSLYLQGGAPVEGERIARAWLEADGSSLLAKRQLAWALALQGKEQGKALELVREVAEAKPDDPMVPSLLMGLISGGAGPATQPTSGSQPASTAPAELEQRQARLRACETALADMVARHPDLPGWRLALANYYRAGGDFDPRSVKDEAEARRQLGRITDLFLEQLKQVEGLEKLSVDQLMEVAQIRADLGMFDRAAASFDRAEKLEPANLELYLRRCQLAIERDDYADGAAIIDRALSQNWGERRELLLEPAAECYARSGRVEDARKHFEQLKAANAESSVLDYIQACISEAEGKTDAAVKGYQTAILRFPKFEEAASRNSRIIRWKLAYARALIANGQPDRAVIPLTEYLGLERRRLEDQHRPSLTGGDLELIDLYMRLQRWEDAQQAFKLADGRAGGSWLHYRLRRQEFFLQASISAPNGPSPSAGTLERLAKGLDDLGNKLPSVREDVQLQLLAAQIDAWLGKVDSAAARLRALREKSKDGPAATEALVRILEEAGRHEDALRECSEAAKSEDAKTRTRFEELTAALLIRHGSTDQGVATLEKAIERAEGEQRTALRLKLAALFAGQRRLVEAAELLTKIADEEPKNIDARQMLFELPTGDGIKIDRQQIVDQIKKIEGEEGVAWKYRQATLWLGTDLWSSKKAEVEKLLQACIMDKPSWWEPMAALILFRERSSTADKAIETIKELMARETTDEAIKASLRLLLIEVAGRAEKWADVDAALDAFPAKINNPAIMSTLETYRVEQAIRRGYTDRAKTILERKVKESPDDFRSRFRLALILQSELQPDPDGGKAGRVSKLLDEAARIAPFDSAVLSARVGVLISRKQFDEALKLCDAAIESGQNPDAIRDRSRVWEQQGDLEKALADIQSFTRVEGRAEKAFLALGQFYYRHDRTEDALQAWREGLKHVPKSVDLRGALVEVLLGKGDEESGKQAMSLIESRLAENAEDPDFLMLRADLLLDRDPEEAVRLYERVIKTTPSAAKAFTRLAQMELTRKRPERATELVDQGLAGSPNSPPLLQLKAGMLIDSKPSESVAFAAKAADLEPDDEQTVLLLADALSRTGALARSIETLEQYLKREKAQNAVDARLNLARLLIQEKRLDEAESRLVEAEKLAPGSTGAVLGRLALHGARQQWDSLIALAESTLEKKPDALAVAETAGSQLLAADDPAVRKRAIPFFDRILSKHPDAVEIQTVVGMACYQAGEFKRAAELLEQAVAKVPDNLELLNNLVWITCEDLKDPANAEKLAAKAIEGGADYPNLWDTWGVVLYRLGRTKEAVDSFDKARAHREATLDTKHSAMFHKARAIAETDKKESLDLLNQLLGSSRTAPKLSASEKKEAEDLLAALKSNAGAAGSGS